MSDYSSALMTEAGQLPYLNDITLSNAEAVYWERIYSKKTKTYRYEYSVLYPFPEQTRRQLIELSWPSTTPSRPSMNGCGANWARLRT